MQTLRPIRVGFDVDDTLIDFDRRLRPRTHDVFAELHHRGFDLFIWSGVGLRWEIAQVHNLQQYILGCYWKPVSRHRERLGEHGVPFVPDFVVDDDREVVDAFGGYHIAPPAFRLDEDHGLLNAFAAIVDAFPCVTPRSDGASA